MGIRMYAGLGILGMLFLVSLSDAKGCQFKGKFHKFGSNWVQGRKHVVCECMPNGTVHCHDNLGKCVGVGDPHYTSYDGKRFDFQGVCRYVLSRDCCNNSFSIEVEQIAVSPSASITHKFTIRFGSKVVHLEKVQILTVHTLPPPQPGLFFDDAELRCEMVGGWMMVTLKNLGIWLRWDWSHHVQVYADRKYQGHLCGLCADFNGDPNNDLSLTPSGEPVTTTPEWGESWRTKRQPLRCNGSAANIEPPPINNCKKNHKYVALMAMCRSIMMGPSFAACRRKINPTRHIADCETDMCECAKMKRKGCICQAVNGYENDCIDAGIAISNAWKPQYNCGVCKDPVTGAIYGHARSWRHGCLIYTCTNGVVTKVMSKGCCKNNGQQYLNGQTWQVGCEIRTCNNGKITITMHKDCCYHNKQYYHNGQSWQVGCKIYTCNKGNLTVAIRKDCCYYKGHYYRNGQSWQIGCKIYTCKNGKVTIAVHKDCCYYKGHFYRNGQSWQVGCKIYTCNKGKITTAIRKDCCSYNRRYYLPGQKYSATCKTCVCSSGKWQCTINKACCVHQGVYYNPGQSFSLKYPFVCLECTCKNRRIQCIFHSVRCPAGFKLNSRCKCVLPG